MINRFLLIQYIGQPNHNFCSVMLGDIWVPDYLKYLTSANLLKAKPLYKQNLLCQYTLS